MNKKFWQFKTISQETTDLYIYGDIEDYKWIESDVTSFDFAKELQEIETPNLNVRINSYGGSVASGLAIYNLIKLCGKNVATIVDGFACSAASVIFMAGTKRVMPSTSLLMIHNAWSWGSGNANDFRKMADDLDKITQPSIEAYKSVSTISEDEIKQLMDDETWITAEKALEYGFATDVESDQAQQSINGDYYLRNQIFANISLKKEITKLKEELSKTKQSDPWENYFGGIKNG